MSNGVQSSQKVGLWLAFGAFIVLAVLLKDYIRELKFGPQGVVVSLGDARRIKDYNSSQQSEKVDELLKRLNQHTLPANPVSARLLVSGSWKSTAGLYYRVDQIGNYLTIREINPAFGGAVTAAAGGYINGPKFSIPYYTLYGTSGTLTLQVSEDGRQMTGAFSDSIGWSGALQLNKSN